MNTENSTGKKVRMSRKRLLQWLALAVAVVILDQASKYTAEYLLHYQIPVAVLPSLNWFLSYNPGAAFSFLSDAGGWQRWFFTLMALAVSIGITIWLSRLPHNSKWEALSLTLILGGALGNVIDRVLLGHVIDFIQVYYDTWYFPTFNLADSAISVGVAILIVDSLFLQKDKDKTDG